MENRAGFIGIGAQKAASTWVYRILEDHPEVICSEVKELDFFSKYFEKGIDWYHAQFKQQKSSQCLFGEISPSYFIDDKTPYLVKEYNPEIKIIVTLRDPVERAYSNHLHMIRIGCYPHSDTSFEYGLSVDKNYLEQSYYAKYLSQWFSLFPRENILILFQEDMSVNPENEVKKLYQFLGIDVNHRSNFLNRKGNESYFVKHQWFKNISVSIFKVLNILGLGKFIVWFRKTRFFLYVRDKNRGQLRDKLPKMKQETRNRLMDELSGDVKQLAELLELDGLPWETWRYIEKTKSKKIEDKYV